MKLLVVFLLTKLANRRRVQKIAFRDQIIMAFGGIRGAICYGLVLSIGILLKFSEFGDLFLLDEQDIPSKQMLISTTLCVICVTVFIQVYSLISYDLLRESMLADKCISIFHCIIGTFL